MPASALVALLDPSSMRLAMGELDPVELELAQSAVKSAVQRLGEHSLTLVPHSPEPALLMSIAIRLDHGLGVAGYYDQFSALGLDMPGPSHAQRLENTLSLARQAHDALLALPSHSMESVVIEDLQRGVLADLSTTSVAVDPGNEDIVGVIKSAVRYALANVSKHGLCVLSAAPDPSSITAIAQVLEHAARQEGLPKGVSEDGMKNLWHTDAGRIYEEISGVGFYQPNPARPATRRP